MNRYLKLNENVMNTTVSEIKELLKVEDVEIDYFKSFFDFHICDKDGNQLRNDPYGLILFIDNIREQLSEENVFICREEEELLSEEKTSAESKLSKLNDDEITSHFHYDLVCESPLEMTLKCQKNSIATGMFAMTILYYMKSQLKQEFIDDDFKRKNRKMSC